MNKNWKTKMLVYFWGYSFFYPFLLNFFVNNFYWFFFCATQAAFSTSRTLQNVFFFLSKCLVKTSYWAINKFWWWWKKVERNETCKKKKKKHFFETKGKDRKNFGATVCIWNINDEWMCLTFVKAIKK